MVVVWWLVGEFDERLGGMMAALREIVLIHKASWCTLRQALFVKAASIK